MGWDLALLESGNGGDLTMNGNDFAVYYNDENDVYLRLFGGNVAANTNPNRKTGEQDLSYWGNKLLFNNDPNISFNSRTEWILNNTALTSKGRTIIENAIKKDLSGLTSDVSVSIVSTDRIDTTIKYKGVVKKYSFIRNPLTGDFDFNDFDNTDFF